MQEDSSSTRHTAAAASDRSGPRRSRRLSANPSAATAATAADPAALAAISAAVGDAPHLPQNDIDAIAKTLAAERLSKPRECATGGAIDPDQLTHLCPLSPLKQRTDSPWQRQCQALLLENVCIVQETFVVYDPRQPDGGPAVPADLFETHDIKYWRVARFCCVLEVPFSARPFTAASPLLRFLTAAAPAAYARPPFSRP